MTWEIWNTFVTPVLYASIAGCSAYIWGSIRKNVAVIVEANRRLQVENFAYRETLRELGFDVQVQQLPDATDIKIRQTRPTPPIIQH